MKNCLFPADAWQDRRGNPQRAQGADCRCVHETHEEIEVIESFFEGAPADATPLWYLGESLKLLGTADFVVFAPGWQDYRGCRIEHDAAVAYGIPIVEV